MAADTAWGWALMSVPVMYWTLGFVLLVHKSPFAAIVFWSAVAYIQCQVALVAMMAFILFVGMRAVYSGGVNK
ncbi:permease, partial [Escherichia coli]|nr:permease [Escherichia coli]